MGNWKFIKPESTTNLFSDPSLALADPDTEWGILGDGGGGEDYTRSSTYAYYGFSAAYSTLGGSAYSILLQQLTVTATSYTLSARVRRNAGGVVSNTQCQAYFNSSSTNWDSITSLGNGWYLCVKTGTPTAGARFFGVRANEGALWVDGCQLENKAYYTTYCDGDQEGCVWNGAPNASTSTRSAMSRAGGRIYDFEDDYSFSIVDWMGWGVPPHLLNLDSYAILPGAQVNSIKTEVSTLTLTGYFKGSTMSNLHALRQALVEELAHDRYPKTAEGWQPVRIRYTGATVPKEAKVFYDSGLEGGGMVGNAFTERIPIRFLMADPFWYEVGESSKVLDTNDTATLRYLAGRLKSTGQWDDMGLTADPAADGSIYAIHVASDKTVYFGGDYDGLNNDGAPADAGCDMIARYDPTDESWNVLVGASDVNDAVYGITEGPAGSIYICGAFDSVNGDGTQDNIVRYDPSADTWDNLGDPDTTNITAMRDMAWDSSGNLYVVGDFTAVAAVANTAYIAMWDGSSWNAVGAPSVGAGYPLAVAVGPDDKVYIGGSFTNFAGVAAADYLAVWDGSSWSDLGAGTQSGLVFDLVFDDKGWLYIAGSFTNQGGDADCDKICAWNGTNFVPMPGAVEANSLAVADDGQIFASGGTVAGEVRSWNGSAWTRWDTNRIVYTVAVGKADPVIPTNYDIFIGMLASGSSQIGGDATVTNDGTAAQYPQIVISRSGGTSANLKTIRNETTGKALMFNYDLLNGETLTIDCRPGKKSIISNYFGRRPDAMYANSDFGNFTVQAGDNTVTAFVYTVGAPTITAYLLWKDAYRGMD